MSETKDGFRPEATDVELSAEGAVETAGHERKGGRGSLAFLAAGLFGVMGLTVYSERATWQQVLGAGEFGAEASACTADEFSSLFASPQEQAALRFSSNTERWGACNRTCGCACGAERSEGNRADATRSTEPPL